MRTDPPLLTQLIQFRSLEELFHKSEHYMKWTMPTDWKKWTGIFQRGFYFGLSIILIWLNRIHKRITNSLSVWWEFLRDLAGAFTTTISAGFGQLPERKGTWKCHCKLKFSRSLPNLCLLLQQHPLREPSSPSHLNGARVSRLKARALAVIPNSFCCPEGKSCHQHMLKGNTFLSES